MARTKKIANSVAKSMYKSLVSVRCCQSLPFFLPHLFLSFLVGQILPLFLDIQTHHIILQNMLPAKTLDINGHSEHVRPPF
jgi:hypothetical protein